GPNRHRAGTGRAPPAGPAGAARLHDPAARAGDGLRDRDHPLRDRSVSVHQQRRWHADRLEQLRASPEQPSAVRSASGHRLLCPDRPTHGDPARSRVRLAGPSHRPPSRAARHLVRVGRAAPGGAAGRRRRGGPAHLRPRLRRAELSIAVGWHHPFRDPVAGRPNPGDGLGGHRRHLAMDAIRVPGSVCGTADGAPGIRGGGSGGRRHLVDAVHLHRAALPVAALSVDPVLSDGRRPARLRPRLHPHRGRAGHDHPAAESLHVPDRVQVFRRRTGGRPGGAGTGIDQRSVCAGHPGAAPGARLMRRRRRSAAVWARVALITVGLAVAGLLYAFPLYWLVVTSLKSKAELYTSITLFPRSLTLESYGNVLIDSGFWMLLRNSVIVCLSTVIVTIAVGLVITYPLTRLPVPPRLRVGVLNWALSLRFLPPIAVVIPYFAIVRTLQIYDQPIALIGIYSLFNLPFAIWMLKGFLAEIPLEVEEVALVDGANRWTAFLRVLLPLAAPGIMAAGIIVFTFAWSEFLFALILTATPNAQTFPVGVQGLVTQFAIIWNQMAAAGV